jgi:hypothetical protein
MRLILSRSGGVAGMVRRPLEIDTSSLPAAEASRIRNLVASAGFFELPDDLDGGQGSPDAFGYELTVVDDDGTEHAVSFAMHGAPTALRDLVTAVRGLPGPG